jgi:serine/threonine protein kinase
VGFLDIFKDLFSPKKKKKSEDGGDRPSVRAKAKAAEKVKAAKKAEAAKPQKKSPRVNVEKRFDLMGRIGQGSMSKVWRARDRKLGKTVCLKVLDKEKTAKFEARFVGLKRPTEGAILTDLRHKNIVQTFEHGLTSKGEQFLVMELVEGVGLNFLIETGAPQLQGNRCNYLIQIADGLDYMHRKGYLHRDICPRNIMVDQESVVKLIDFGLSIPYTPDFCKPGNRTGTTDYLAPEIIKRNTTDHRVDLFALGVTAYEIFTGQLPWEKKQDSMQTLLTHLSQNARKPQDLKPDLDPKIVKFLIKSVARDPNDRFQTALEFREAVKSLPQS